MSQQPAAPGSATEQGGGAGRLGIARLRFEDEEAEQGFADYWFDHGLLFTRYAIVLAVVLYALFGILDQVVVPEEASWIWSIRAMYCTVALGFLAFTYSDRYRRVMQPALCTLSVVTGLALVAMVAIVAADDGALYYVGILLAIQWSYAVLQLRVAWASAATLVVLVGYELAAIWHRPTSLEVFVNNNFFLLSTTIIGMLAGYTIERGVRTDFLQRRVIEAQRSQLRDQNRHLDSALQVSLEEVRAKAVELQASRARVVATADEERRRIERDLHDGAQQNLVALAVNLRLARELLAGDPESSAGILDELGASVRDTIGELRALAHGIYPPLLMESGLPAALRTAADRCPLLTEVDASVGRYPSEVEASVYFCVLEALQNAAKHAPGAAVEIRLWEEAGALRFEVVDDGPGLPGGGGAQADGHGFVNMADRLGALGGSVVWTSGPGPGLSVSGSVPVSSAPAASEGAGDVTSAEPVSRRATIGSSG